MKKHKKLILLGGVAILVAAGLYLVTAKKFDLPPFAAEKILSQKDTIQASLQQADSCNDTNLDNLQNLYNATGSQEDKALYAEQLATCFGVKQDFTNAVTWYQKAKEGYEKIGNADKTAAMELGRQSNEERAKNPAIIGPADPANDQSEGMY